MLAPKRRIAAIAVICLAAMVVAGGLYIAAVNSAKNARERVIAKISSRFQSEVELRALSISVFPSPSVHGEGLILRHRGRRDVPPLISIDAFDANTGWFNLTWNHLSEVRLYGLKITVPPKSDFQTPGKDHPVPVTIPTIGTIVADGAVLVRMPRAAGKDPLEWRMRQLVITDVDRKGAMKYRTKLENAKPPGLIDANGHFGPWNADEPGDTPLDGAYSMRNANLDAFTGIGGILSANGGFHGVLDTIQTHGTTDVPDFSVDTSGKPVHLVTEYDAIVDGTDGDTYLRPVKVSFGRTVLIASGAIEGSKNRKGKQIRLDVHTEKARMEDLLLLAVKSDKPVLTGPMHFNTKFFIPSGPGRVVEKLKLDGQFGVGGAHFTEAVQDQIDLLSRKGQGQPKNQEIDNVAASLRGIFRLNRGSMSLSRVSFEVPGAQVFVDGTFELPTQEMSFTGHLLIDAPVSKTITGFKSVLLKMADPIFKKKEGKGSSIPIRITGTPPAPRYGVEVKKALHKQ